LKQSKYYKQILLQIQHTIARGSCTSTLIIYWYWQWRWLWYGYRAQW